ncbi:hypothetical protein T439DRAFT_378176 [Meredithblackwellia eburnea MCA 4105]
MQRVPFTVEDKQQLAEYLATIPKESRSRPTTFEPFAKTHPRHSVQAWHTHYRDAGKNDIDTRIIKIERQRKRDRDAQKEAKKTAQQHAQVGAARVDGQPGPSNSAKPAQTGEEREKTENDGKGKGKEAGEGKSKGKGKGKALEVQSSEDDSDSSFGDLPNDGNKSKFRQKSKTRVPYDTDDEKKFVQLMAERELNRTTTQSVYCALAEWNDDHSVSAWTTYHRDRRELLEPKIARKVARLRDSRREKQRREMDKTLNIRSSSSTTTSGPKASTSGLSSTTTLAARLPSPALGVAPAIEQDPPPVQQNPSEESLPHSPSKIDLPIITKEPSPAAAAGPATATTTATATITPFEEPVLIEVAKQSLSIATTNTTAAKRATSASPPKSTTSLPKSPSVFDTLQKQQKQMKEEQLRSSPAKSGRGSVPNLSPKRNHFALPSPVEPQIPFSKDEDVLIVDFIVANMRSPVKAPHEWMWSSLAEKEARHSPQEWQSRFESKSHDFYATAFSRATKGKGKAEPSVSSQGTEGKSLAPPPPNQEQMFKVDEPSRPPVFVPGTASLSQGSLTSSAPLAQKPPTTITATTDSSQSTIEVNTSFESDHLPFPFRVPQEAQLSSAVPNAVPAPDRTGSTRTDSSAMSEDERRLDTELKKAVEAEKVRCETLKEEGEKEKEKDKDVEGEVAAREDVDMVPVEVRVERLDPPPSVLEVGVETNMVIEGVKDHQEEPDEGDGKQPAPNGSSSGIVLNANDHSTIPGEDVDLHQPLKEVSFFGPLSREEDMYVKGHRYEAQAMAEEEVAAAEERRRVEKERQEKVRKAAERKAAEDAARRRKEVQAEAQRLALRQAKEEADRRTREEAREHWRKKEAARMEKEEERRKAKRAADMDRISKAQEAEAARLARANLEKAREEAERAPLRNEATLALEAEQEREGHAKPRGDVELAENRRKSNLTRLEFLEQDPPSSTRKRPRASDEAFHRASTKSPALSSPAPLQREPTPAERAFISSTTTAHQQPSALGKSTKTNGAGPSDKDDPPKAKRVRIDAESTTAKLNMDRATPGPSNLLELMDHVSSKYSLDKSVVGKILWASTGEPATLDLLVKRYTSLSSSLPVDFHVEQQAQRQLWTMADDNVLISGDKEGLELLRKAKSTSLDDRRKFLEATRPAMKKAKSKWYPKF